VQSAGAGPRELHAALAHHRLVAVGKVLYELVGSRVSCRGVDSVAVGLEAAVGDVLGDGPVEQERFLGDVAHGPAQVRHREVAHVVTIESDRPTVGVVEANEQANERRLAAPGRADDTDGFPGRNREGDASEDRRTFVCLPLFVFRVFPVVLHILLVIVTEAASLAVVVAERHVLVFDRSTNRVETNWVLGLVDRPFGVEKTVHAVAGGLCALVFVDDLAELCERPDELLAVEHERHELPRRDGTREECGWAVQHPEGADTERECETQSRDDREPGKNVIRVRIASQLVS